MFERVKKLIRGKNKPIMITCSNCGFINISEDIHSIGNVYKINCEGCNKLFGYVCFLSINSFELNDVSV